MDYYRNLLIKEKSEYKCTNIHLESEEVNIGIKNVERAIMSLKNDRMYGSEDICVKLQKDETEKLIPNIEQHHQPMFKQISSTRSMKSGIHFFNFISFLHTRKNSRRIRTTIEEFW